MGWQDAPIVGEARPAWESAPIVGEAESPEMAAGLDQLSQMTREPEVSAPEQPGMLKAAFTGLSQGATFGWGDEIVSRILSAHPDITYDQALSYLQQDIENTRKARPYMTGAGEIAGAVAAPMVGMAGRAIAAAPSLGAKMLAGGAAGAVQGGLYGAGSADPGERAQGAGTGALVGGMVGAAAPLVIRGGEKVVEAGRNALARRAASGETAQALGVSRPAAKAMQGVIGADDPVQMAEALRRAGPDAMLADAGPTTAGALDAALQSPGRGARVGMERVEKRAADALTKITGTLDDVLGKPQGAETAQAAIRQGTAATRQAVYDAAYAAPINYADDTGRALEGLLPRVPGKVIADANRLMQLDGDVSRQIMAQIGDDGSVAFQRMPDVRQWDYIKRALDQAASAGEGQGALGGQTPLGRAYQGLSRTIRDRLAAAVPEYRTALDTAADAISQTKGIETGYSLLRAGTTRESIREAVKGATKPEIAAIRQGVRSYLDDALANVRAVASDPNIDAREARKALAELTSRASREKLNLILGAKEANKLTMALSQTTSALGLRAQVATNSKTFGRQMFGQQLEDLTAPGVVGQLGQGSPLQAAKRGISNLTGMSPGAISARQERIRSELADVLTRQGQGQNYLLMLEDVARRDSPAPMGSVVNSLSGIVGGAAAPAYNALVGR